MIILGNGYGAIRAQKFIKHITPNVDDPKLKATLEKPVRAMVLMNGRDRLPSMQDSYEEWFTDPTIPILDIVVQTDHRNQQAAKLRKTIARQKNVKVYKQVRLIEMSREKSWGSNSLSRRILGFLDTHAAGIEVRNATLRRYK